MLWDTCGQMKLSSFSDPLVANRFLNSATAGCGS